MKMAPDSNLGVSRAGGLVPPPVFTSGAAALQSRVDGVCACLIPVSASPRGTQRVEIYFCFAFQVQRDFLNKLLSFLVFEDDFLLQFFSLGLRQSDPGLRVGVVQCEVVDDYRHSEGHSQDPTQHAH